MTSAMIDETSVPKIAGAAPKLPLTGSQSLDVRKPKPNVLQRRPPRDADLDADERRSSIGMTSAKPVVAQR